VYSCIVNVCEESYLLDYQNTVSTRTNERVSKLERPYVVGRDVAGEVVGLVVDDVIGLVAGEVVGDVVGEVVGDVVGCRASRGRDGGARSWASRGWLRWTDCRTTVPARRDLLTNSRS
jgi:hypothetical protein